jgi:hypothetical protein
MIAMTKKKAKTITVIDGVLGLSVRCQVGGEEKAAHDAAERWLGERPEGDADGTNAGWTCGAANRAFIWIARPPSSPYGIGILVHECVHAASQHCKFTGIEDEETFAHLVQYFVTQLLAKSK